LKDFRVSTVIAALALFALIGGSATAASGLISGKKIMRGTITAKQIANRTITTSKLTPATIGSLRGRTGATGPAGTVSPLHAEASYLTLDGNVLLSLDVPAGMYMLTAKADVTSNNTTDAYVECSIWTDETDAVDQASADPVSLNQSVSLSMMAVSQVAGKVELRCNGYDVAGNARNVKLIALPVGG
jgi:hypothetical protein